MTAKRKAKKRTVTVWLFTDDTYGEVWIGEIWPLRKDAERDRKRLMDHGFKCGPITKVEVPCE